MYDVDFYMYSCFHYKSADITHYFSFMWKLNQLHLSFSFRIRRTFDTQMYCDVIFNKNAHTNMISDFKLQNSTKMM